MKFSKLKAQTAVEYLLLAGGVIVFVIVAVVLVKNIVLNPSQNATANLSNQITNYITTSNQTGVVAAPVSLCSSDYCFTGGGGSAGGSNSSNLTNSTWVVNNSNYGFSSVYVTYQPVGLIKSSDYVLCVGPACTG
jgi:hypothetical protein